MLELLLVSESPRRRQILEEAGFLFRVDTVKISETIEKNVNLPDAISQIAQTKAQAYLREHKQLKGQNILLLSADTMVILENQPLGKPKNSTEAQEFLRRLSGKTHSVISGICLENLQTGETFVQADTTKVEFKTLSENEISGYVAGGEGHDKAGSYAIQGDGKKFVKKIEGSYTNVVGLPLELFERALAEKGWHVRRK